MTHYDTHMLDHMTTVINISKNFSSMWEQLYTENNEVRLFKFATEIYTRLHKHLRKTDTTY